MTSPLALFGIQHTGFFLGPGFAGVAVVHIFHEKVFAPDHLVALRKDRNELVVAEVNAPVSGKLPRKDRRICSAAYLLRKLPHIFFTVKVFFAFHTFGGVPWKSLRQGKLLRTNRRLCIARGHPHLFSGYVFPGKQGRGTVSPPGYWIVTFLAKKCLIRNRQTGCNSRAGRRAPPASFLYCLLALSDLSIAWQYDFGINSTTR